MYAIPLATAIRSLVEAHHGGEPLEIYVLSDGFSAETRLKVSRSISEYDASIQWVSIDLTAFEHFSGLPYTSKMTYARIQIPYLLPSRIARVLYLDADLLVLDDVEKIWETDVEGCVLAAVVDQLDSQIKANQPGLERLPRVRDYFNAGVLFLDLSRWKEERISERAMEYLNENPSSFFADQDALNAVCDGLWKKLDPRWNFQACRVNNIADMSEAARPGIVHFVMGAKPWNAGVKNINAGFYDSFRSRTCFARNSRDKSVDFVLGAWCGLKIILKRNVLPQFVYKRLRPYPK
jgi:lipopolysaccharide biosynthesis glycosyltransferase